MSNDWVTSVDMLADAGIINFDAAAYVTGTRPRYACTPQFPIEQMPSLDLSQPQADTFSSSTSNSIVKNPGWKQWVFGALAIGGLVWGAKTLSKNPIKSFGNLGPKIGTFFADGWKNFTSIFKKKP